MRSVLNAPGGWDNTAELLAEQVDLSNVIVRILQVVNSERPPQGDIPRRPRPYEAPVEPETVDLAGLNNFLEV